MNIDCCMIQRSECTRLTLVGMGNRPICRRFSPSLIGIRDSLTQGKIHSDTIDASCDILTPFILKPFSRAQNRSGEWSAAARRDNAPNRRNDRTHDNGGDPRPQRLGSHWLILFWFFIGRVGGQHGDADGCEHSGEPVRRHRITSVTEPRGRSTPRKCCNYSKHDHGP